MRNYALDTTMLPKVWITWASTKNRQFSQRYWLNCSTGKKKTKPESWMYYESENDIKNWPWRARESGKIVCGVNYLSRNSDKIWVQSGSNVRYAYAKYHADIDRLEVAIVGVDTNRKEEPHPWHFIGGRFFIGKDKSIIDQHGNVLRYPVSLYEYHSAWHAKELIRKLVRVTETNSFVSEFKKFIGDNNFFIGNGSVVSIANSWHLQRWYETTQKARGKGVRQKLTDELVEIELCDVNELAEKYNIQYITEDDKNRRYSYWDVFESVTDEWCVLRRLRYNSTTDAFYEISRVYIHDDGNVLVASQANNEWMPSKYNQNRWWGYTRLVNKDEAIAGCKRIKYVLSSLKNVDDVNVMNLLVAALRIPEIEQIAKLGYCDEMCHIANSHTPKADLKHMFGQYDDKEKNVLNKVGMTKHQFDTYMSSNSYRRREAMMLMRSMFGESLKHMDNASFDKYFKACVKIKEHFWRSLDSYAISIGFDAQRFLKNMVRLNEKRDNAIQIAHDTLSTYTQLNAGTSPTIDWYFEDLSDLARAHDAITELYRMQLAERRARYTMQEAERKKQEEENLIKIDAKRKEYEYEDDEYIIRLPKNLNEIISEGSKQSICIGGYTSRHANGHTNLFFLRKKDDADTPFYAIEMNNQKQIVQIHGRCNRWLGNDPDAIPTVVRWLRKNGITCDEKILTCTSTGYGRTGHYVAMPVVD